MRLRPAHAMTQLLAPCAWQRLHPALPPGVTGRQSPGRRAAATTPADYEHDKLREVTARDAPEAQLFTNEPPGGCRGLTAERQSNCTPRGWGTCESVAKG